MKVKALYVRNEKTGELEFVASAREEFDFDGIADELRSRNREVSVRQFPCLSMVTDVIDEGVPA